MSFRGILTSFVITIIVFSTALAGPDMEGSKAPDFVLKDIDGKRVQLSDYLAKGPVLLDFWASWCAPCKQAIPHLEKIYKEYKGKGFTLLLISIDNTRSVSKVKPFVKSQRLESPVLLDTKSEVLKKYRGTNVPHTVLINSEGNIQKVWISYHPGEEKEISNLVAEMLTVEGEKE